MVVDYTLIDHPRLRLTLEDEGTNYIVVDQTDGDTVYMRNPDIGKAITFMFAMRAHGEAVIDEGAMLWYRLLESRAIVEPGHSVKVSTLSEREPARQDTASSQAPSVAQAANEPASRSESVLLGGAAVGQDAVPSSAEMNSGELGRAAPPKNTSNVVPIRKGA